MLENKNQVGPNQIYPLVELKLAKSLWEEVLAICSTRDVMFLKLTECRCGLCSRGRRRLRGEAAGLHGHRERQGDSGLRAEQRRPCPVVSWREGDHRLQDGGHEVRGHSKVSGLEESGAER